MPRGQAPTVGPNNAPALAVLDPAAERHQRRIARFMARLGATEGLLGLVELGPIDRRTFRFLDRTLGVGEGAVGVGARDAGGLGYGHGGFQR